jgi:hypothetical protein
LILKKKKIDVVQKSMGRNYNPEQEKKKKKSQMILKMENGNEEAVEYLKNHTYSISGNRKVMVKFHISLMISLWNISCWPLCSSCRTICLSLI